MTARGDKCVRCGEPATFDSPRAFCDEHWARFWGGYDPELPYEAGEEPSEQMYREALETITSRQQR